MASSSESFAWSLRRRWSGPGEFREVVQCDFQTLIIAVIREVE
jgi:hypothetical protein